MAPLFTANLSTLTSSLVETAALTNVFTINLADGDPVATPRTITVPYTVTGSALNGTDYQTLTGSVSITIAANATSGSATVQIDPIDDLQLEGTETLTLSLSADPSATPQYVLGTTQTSSTIAIVDDLSASETSLLPQISVIANDPVAEEVASTLGAATASFTFTRSSASAANPLTVYFTVGGTATPDPDPSTTPEDSGDYVQTTLGTAFIAPPNSNLPSTRFITFAANQTSVTVSFNAIDDAEFDPNESVTITILPSNLVNANPADQYTIGNSSATATIADNEVIPTVSISPASNTLDEGGSQTFTLTLENGPVSRDLYIQLNIGGTATNPNLLLDINGGSNAGADTGDDFFVPDFLLNVPDPNNPGGTTLATTPTVFIAAGQTTATFTVRTLSDSNPVNDDNETVTVTVLGGGNDYAVGTTGSATLNIRDLDNQGQISITPGTSLAIEGGTTSTFTLNRTGYNLGQVVVPFTLNGSAISLTDYTLAVTSGNATIDLANQTITLDAVAGTTQTVTVVLTAVADGVVDSVTGNGTETVTLTLTNSTTGLYTLGTSASTGEIRIEDVDILQLPTVTIASGPATVREEETNTGSYGVFTLTRSGGNSLQFPLTVAYRISGSATNGTDYSNLTGTVIFAAGSATAEVVIAPLDDLIFEGTESITLTLADPVNSPPQYVLGAATSATVAITEGETANTGIPRITVLATDPTAEEVNSANPLVINPGVFTVTLNGTITSALIVNYTIGGSATAGVDYQALTGSITFDVGGPTSKTIDVRAIDDLIADPNETVNITISSSPNYTIGTDAFAEVTVVDNDDRGPFTVATTQALGIEGGQDARFTIDRATDLVGSTTVNFTLGGTATAGTDYTVITLDGAGNEVILNPAADGSYSVTFTSQTGDATDLQRVILVRSLDDAVFEGLVNETVTLTLQTPNNSTYTLGTPLAGTASIQDNEAEVSISATNFSLAEGGTGGIFTISRTSSDLTNALIVNYRISGTAANGTDYQLLSGTATIAANASSIDIPFNVINDALVESIETLILSLDSGRGYSFSNNSSITFFISDNEPSVFVNATTDTVVEGAGNGVFTITRIGGDTSQDLVVNYTVTGTAVGSTDYALLPGTATILAGQTSVTVNVATFDDPVFEGSESVTLTIDSSNSYRVSTFELQSDTVTITDANDLLLETVRITATPSSVAENVTNPALRSIFTITRDAANGFAEDLIVFYTISGSAVAGTDYNTITGSVTIAAGQASATVEIAPLDDLDVEGTESVTLTLTDPVQGPPRYVFNNAQSSATIAITDNETLPGSLPQVTVLPVDLTPDPSDATPSGASEVNAVDPTLFDRGQFTFFRTGAIDTELTVNYTVAGTATSGTDYQTITNSITFAIGEDRKTIDITAIDDTAVEGPETVQISILSNANYTIGTDRVATVTIVDDEVPRFIPTLSIATLASPASEGTLAPAAFRITRTFENNNPNLAPFLEDISLTVGGTALVNNDYNFSLRTARNVIIPISTNLTTIDIPEGDAFIDVLITPKQDGEVDPNETVTISLTAVPGEYLVNSNQSSATATILDTNAVSGVTVSVELAPGLTNGDSIAEESNPVNAFIIRRQGGDDAARRAQALAVNLNITGTATPNEDYVALNSIVVIPVGVDQVVIPLTPIGDTIADTGGNESVTVTIAPTANGSYTVALDENVNPNQDPDTIPEPSSTSVFIIDNENNAPVLNADLLNDFVLNEDAGAVELKNGNGRTFAQLVVDAFSDEDINVPENENETLKAIRFITLPANGNLTLNGVLVTENQVVTFANNAQISQFLSSLRYTPNTNFFGQPTDSKSGPDTFKIVANDGVANSRETDIVVSVRPVNDAPFYVLPGESGFVGGSAAIPTDFYRDSAVIDNRAFSGGNTRNFALLPGTSISIRDFVQGGANEPNPVVGPQNERVNDTNSTLANGGNQTLTFSTSVVSESDIFEVAPAISADGTLTFKLKSTIPGGIGTAQVRVSAKDNGGTANNGVDTLIKGFFIVTADENTLGQVIQSFETPVGGTGSLIYNSTAFPVGSNIRVNLQNDVLRLGTSASLDNIVGLYEIADPTGAIDTNGDGIGDIAPTANNRAAYARAALQSHLTSGSLQTFNLRAGSNGDPNKNSTVSSFNRQGQSSTSLQQGVVIEGGKLYAPFIIANGGTLISSGSGGTIAGAIGTFLTAVNPNNSAVSNVNSPVAYFSFSEVNPDGADHLLYIRNESTIVNGQTQTVGIFGFEDSPGGGDRDFNDAIFGFQFIAPVIA